MIPLPVHGNNQSFSNLKPPQTDIVHHFIPYLAKFETQIQFKLVFFSNIEEHQRTGPPSVNLFPMSKRKQLRFQTPKVWEIGFMLKCSVTMYKNKCASAQWALTFKKPGTLMVRRIFLNALGNVPSSPSACVTCSSIALTLAPTIFTKACSHTGHYCSKLRKFHTLLEIHHHCFRIMQPFASWDR